MIGKEMSVKPQFSNCLKQIPDFKHVKSMKESHDEIPY